MTRFRFYITALSSRIEVFPLNHWKTSLVDSRKDGEIFYRRKFTGTLTFTDNNGGDDFTFFYMIESATPCEQLMIEIEEKDSGADTYHDYWSGQFTTSDGVFDLDKCTFEITPKPYDNYYLFDLYGGIQRNILNAGLTLVTTKTYEEDYTRNLWLIDVIEYLVQQIIPAATVTSWFLNNAVNPVTGGVNKYQYLTIAQKSDIRRPNASNPAIIGMISFKEMMDILKMYNLYWTYDGTTIRIEHYDYWEGSAGLDLRIQDISQRQNKYSYIREDMPKFEKFSFMESGDNGYIPHTITYDSPCVSEGGTDEYSYKVTTDLSYIYQCSADPDLVGNISDDGWVILANFWDGVDWRVYYGTSLSSTIGTYNYPNSWGDLLRSFFMHGRVLMEGYIQWTLYDFISARKTKQQNIKAIVCYEDNYDPNDYLTTELGEDWFGGQKGYVKQATIHPDGHVEFNLVYGEDKNTDVVLPERTKNLHIIIDTSSYTEIISILSEPNIYDTYYWIFWNDGVVGEVCQEIMIPAGTIYQEDVSDLSEIFASIKFNFDDASLVGWIEIYNNNEPIDLSDPGDCPAVPPVPPAIPAATTMIGCGQLNTCGAITINWNASAGTTFYKLYRKPDSDLIDQWEEIDNVLATTYDDYWAGTQDGVTFYYKVKCCNVSGCSADSDEKSITAMC